MKSKDTVFQVLSVVAIIAGWYAFFIQEQPDKAIYIMLAAIYIVLIAKN